MRPWIMGSTLLLAFLAVPGRASAMENRHAMGFGYQFGTVSTESGGSYHFRSLPFSYFGRYGGDWGAMVRASVLLPLRASDDFVTFAPKAEYDATQMLDALAGANHRYRGLLGWDVDAGLGAHTHFVRFRSDKYVEWATATMGLGIACSARRSLGAGLWGGYPELGIHLDLNYDFIDLSHGGDLSGAVQGQLAVSLGWTLGDNK